MSRALADLRAAVLAATTTEQQAWVQQAVDRVQTRSEEIETLFPSVGRKVGRRPLDPDAERDDVHVWTVDDAVRTLLLVALGDRAPGTLEDLYRHGDAAERRAVLRALPFLAVGEQARPIVEDAIRTNDTRLIASALGPYAVEHLDDATFAQAVLKCVFVGIPLAGIAGLERRATPELSRMLAQYAHERIAAGRDVPPEVWPLIDRYPPAEDLAAIAVELDHPDEHRRRAARDALVHYPFA
jgi:hypothetical protein